MASYDYSVYYARFHDNSPEHIGGAVSKAAWLRPFFPPDKNSRIADIGCGYGYALLAAREAGYRDVLGVESSEQQAAVARGNGLNVELTGDTVQFLQERPHSFDCLLLLDVIEHVPVETQIDFLRACATSLKPGGRIILTAPNANAIFSNRWRYNDYTHHSSFTEHSLNFVLLNAGFESVEIDKDRSPKRPPLKIWRRSWKPAFRRWLVRFCWRQAFLSEMPFEKIGNISFELNLRALARMPA